MTATVDASGPAPRRRRVLLATVAAALFVVGVLTGGALVTSTAAHSTSANPWWTSSSARDAVLQGVSGGELVGASKVRVHNGSLVIDLGIQPSNANALAVSVPCQQRGKGSILIDGGATARSTYRCSGRSGSVSELYALNPTMPYRLTVTAAKGTRLVVTWGWAKSAKYSELFMIQQQLSQTEEEYDQRVAACAAATLSGVACPSETATPAP
jgi:hypothetical protein